MAKRVSSNKSAKSKPTVRDLERQVAKSKRELLKLLNDHAKLCQRLHKTQQQEVDGQQDAEATPEDWQEIANSNRGPLSDRCVRAVFRELASGTRALAKPTRVAYLGPRYSYSHLAAVERFGNDAELVPVATIASVFEELNRAHVDYGIVPIENSTDGRVVDTLGMFTRLPACICGEVQLRIRHCLLGRCERSEIKEVYSKPQALSQCREWLAKHLPQARTVEMASTTTAAQLAAEKQGAAAIASLQAGVNYGLDVIAEGIEDNRNNVTRFAVIGDHVAGRTGHDKTAVMFELMHTPGALADAMGIFKRNRINLTWIESFPMPGTEKEYLFFVEMEGHQNEMKLKRAIASLERKTVRLDILGSYAHAEPIA